MAKVFCLATQTSTPQVTEKPSQRSIQNNLQPTYVREKVRISLGTPCTASCGGQTNARPPTSGSYGGGHLPSWANLFRLVISVSTTEAAAKSCSGRRILYISYVKKQLNARISTYYLCICIPKMPRVSKRKQHLAKSAPLIVEGIKRRKNIRQIKKGRTF